MPKAYNRSEFRVVFDIDFNQLGAVARVEAGSNTSTVTLRVVGGDEWGSLRSETVIYGLKYQGTQTRERLRWLGPAAYVKDRFEDFMCATVQWYCACDLVPVLYSED
jgi:hypothetical protein